MRKVVSFVLPMVLLLVAVTASHAANLFPPNFGFEAGDTSGWSGAIDASMAQVVTSYVGATRTYEAPEGKYFVCLHGLEYDDPSIMYQHVQMEKGDTLSGWAAFDAEDYLPYADNGGVLIYTADPDDPYVFDMIWGGGIGDAFAEHTSTPWTPFSWTAPFAADFVFAFGTADEGGPNTSYILFDAGLNRPTSTPEPATMALLLMGLPMAALLRRRR